MKHKIEDQRFNSIEKVKFRANYDHIAPAETDQHTLKVNDFISNIGKQ